MSSPFDIDRRSFLQGAVAGSAALAASRNTTAADAAADMKPVLEQVDKRHDEAIHRLQEWIRQPSIAAENRGMTEGCDLQMKFLREAGFDKVTKIPTDGQPGVFATLDAGAPRTFGIYFMYDVKQADPSEWSSPPFDAAIVDKPGLGKALIGRAPRIRRGRKLRFSPRSTHFAELGASCP